jgi:uncharacterized membrane protein
MGLLFVHDASNLERSTFRKLVGLVFFSLVYDLVWFSIYNEDLENKLDGEIQTGLRKFSLLINYFSFLFRVSFIQSQNYFLDTASAYTVERLD